MNELAIDIIKKRIEGIEDIEARFLSKEFDEIVDDNLYIKTLEKHILLLGILNELYLEKSRHRDSLYTAFYENEKGR